MKCPNCAATIGLEDKFCPYCGAANPFAVKHQKDMERYEQSYESVRADITARSRRTASLIAPVVIAAVLLVLNVAAAVFVSKGWEIGRSRVGRKMSAHVEEYRADLDRCLSERDYGGYAGYYSANSLYMLDELDVIGPVERAASCYGRIFSESMNYNGFGYQYAYDRSAESLKKAAGNIAEQVADLYDIENTYRYAEEKYLTAANNEAIAAIRSDTEALLKCWFSLTDEDCRKLPTLSKNGVEDLIIRRAEAHEED